GAGGAEHPAGVAGGVAVREPVAADAAEPLGALFRLAMAQSPELPTAARPGHFSLQGPAPQYIWLRHGSNTPQRATDSEWRRLCKADLQSFRPLRGRVTFLCKGPRRHTIWLRHGSNAPQRA